MTYRARCEGRRHRLLMRDVFGRMGKKRRVVVWEWWHDGRHGWWLPGDPPIGTLFEMQRSTDETRLLGQRATVITRDDVEEGLRRAGLLP